MNLTRTTSFLLLIICLVFTSARLNADHARVGVEKLWRFRVSTIYGSSNQAYDKNGDDDSIISSAVRNYDEDIDMIYPQGQYLGQLKNNAELSFLRTDLLIDYGLTDSIFLEIWIPYYQFKKLKTGKWTFVDNDDNDIMSGTLDEGYGNTACWKGKRLYPGTLESKGLGDIMLGLKQQVYKNDWTRVAYATGLRLPTGKKDDPDNLTDISLGDGQYDLGLWLYWDIIFSNHFFLNFHTRTEYQFESEYKKPVNPTVAYLLDDSDAGGTYKKTPGMYHYFEIEPQWSYFNGRFSPSFIIIGSYKSKDDYEGWTQNGGDLKKEKEDPDSEILRGDILKESNSEQYLITVGPKLYFYHLLNEDKKFTKLPFELSIEYRYPLYGTNIPRVPIFLFEAKLYAKFF